MKKVGLVLIGFMLGVFTTLAVEHLFSALSDDRNKSDYFSMKHLANDLEKFKIKCGQYPSQVDGLSALINKTKCHTDYELDFIPKNFDDKDYLYFVKGDQFFIINPSITYSVLSNKEFDDIKNRKK